MRKPKPDTEIERNQLAARSQWDKRSFAHPYNKAVVNVVCRQDLVSVLGEDNPFIQSFEPNYNRAGGIDTGTFKVAYTLMFIVFSSLKS